MKVITKNQTVLQNKSDVLIIPLFEGEKFNFKSIDDKLNNEITHLITTKKFKGELKEIKIINTHRKLNTKNVMILGLGKEKELKSDSIRKAYAIAVKFARKENLENVSVIIPSVVIKNVDQIITEGIILGLYIFNKYKTVDKNKIKKIKSITLLNAEGRLVKKGNILAENVNCVRDLVNESADKVTPSYLANYAKKIAKNAKNTKIKVFGKSEIVKMGMGGLLAVGKGSNQEPKFIVLEYNGSIGKKEKPFVFVGKGVTFDAGGLDVKPWSYMQDMRSDMAGAATVLQLIKTAQDLKLKKNIVAIVPTCENMLGEKAFKQGDIIKSYNGKNIEVWHTDAEGRLILADGLGYADKNYDAEFVIDIATLTGASIYALGYEIASLMSDDENLKKKIIESGKEVGEYLWELPMIEEYKGLVRGDTGDVRNTAKESPGPGTITAGIFLSNFIKQKWAHIDIGASGWSPKDTEYKKKGGTGHCLRTFVKLLE